MTCGHGLVYIDVVDTSARWPLPDQALESLDGFGLPFDDNLDASIGAVPHPAVQPFAIGGLLCEIPEAHALHATADQISPCHAHAERRIIACVRLKSV